MIFRDIIGHRRLTTLIARAIERESLPPTLLFAGPSGVGKWAVARATAQAVNCLDLRTVESCSRLDLLRRRAGDRRVRQVPIVRSDRARDARRRPDAGARRARVDQDRRGPRNAVEDLLSSVRRPPARGVDSRSRHPRTGGPELAAQVARRAAARDDVHPDERGARGVVADGAIALHAVAFRPPHRRRRSPRA